MKKPIPTVLSICMNDGTTMKVRKKHLIEARHRLSPARYRAMWNLPPDYSLVAPGQPVQPVVAAAFSGDQEVAQAERKLETPHAEPGRLEPK